MNSILTTIVDQKRLTVDQRKQETSVNALMARPLFQRKSLSLKAQLAQKPGVIAEMKRKSPSAGILLSNLDPREQALRYQEQGACAISILTDEPYFGGSLDDLSTVRAAVNLPLLQKDFIIDEYQLFEAKAYGADVVLLIAACLSKELCLHLSIIAKSLGLEVILEVHAQHEFTYINDEVDMVMVNNRDLHRQLTDIHHSEKLLPLLPKDVLKISASGIRNVEEVEYLHHLGYHGVLIGESILKENHLSALTKTVVV